MPEPPEKKSQSESQHRFLKRALGFALVENISKISEPLLVLVCAGLYVGGDWGVFKFYESLIFLFFRISLLGVDKGVIWYYSQTDEKSYLKNIFKCFNLCLAVFALIALASFLSYKDYLPFSSFILGRTYGEFRISSQIFLIYLLSIPFMVWSEMLIHANVNKHNLKYRVLVTSLTVPIMTYGLAIVGYFFFPRILSLPVCFLIGNAAGSCVAALGFFRTHKPTLSDFSFSFLPSFPMLKYSLPLASANIFSAFAVRIDVFMLAGLAGIKSLEIYNVVNMIGNGLISIRQSFENILLSIFSSTGLNVITTKVKHYYNYSIWMVMNIQAGIFLFAVFFGEYLLSLIHAQYALGYYTLLIVSFFIYFNTFANFSAILTMGIGRTLYIPLFQFIFFGLNFGLNYLLIPLYDASGAALALGMANLIAGLLYFFMLKRFGKGWPLLWSYGKAAGINIITIGLLMGSNFLFPFSTAVKIALFAAVMAIALFIQKKYYNVFNGELKNLK